MPGLSSLSSDSPFLPSSPLNTTAAPRTPQSPTEAGALDKIPVAVAAPFSSRIAVDAASVADTSPQEGITEQQHRFDVYNTLQTTAGAASLGLGAGAFKITSIAVLLGAHAPIVGVGLLAFGAAALFNAVTDRPFRPNH